jgi:hypothetical protein
MLRDCSVIYNKARGLHVKLRGFIEFGNYFSTVIPVDQVHGTIDRWHGQVHGELGDGADFHVKAHCRGVTTGVNNLSH